MGNQDYTLRKIDQWYDSVRRLNEVYLTSESLLERNLFDSSSAEKPLRALPQPEPGKEGVKGRSQERKLLIGCSSKLICL